MKKTRQIFKGRSQRFKKVTLNLKAARKKNNSIKQKKRTHQKTTISINIKSNIPEIQNLETKFNIFLHPRRRWIVPILDDTTPKCLEINYTTPLPLMHAFYMPEKVFLIDANGNTHECLTFYDMKMSKPINPNQPTFTQNHHFFIQISKELKRKNFINCHLSFSLNAHRTKVDKRIVFTESSIDLLQNLF